MVLESVEFTITLEQANEVFDKLCRDRRPDGKRWTQEQIAKSLGVNQSTVSRNLSDRKSGLDVTDGMYDVIVGKLQEQHLRELRQKELQEQVEADEAADAQREANERETQRLFEEQRLAAETQDLKRQAAEKAESDRRDGVFSKLQPYWAQMRSKGLSIGVDPAKEGDAPELLAKAQPGDIRYPTFELAAIALTSDDQVYPSGETAAQLREGRTAWHRLKGMYPKRTTKSELVPLILRPDADLHYGEDYKNILTWQRMNAEQSPLALNSLPLIVPPKTAKMFHEFVALDRALCDKGYEFERSCLNECDDVEKRLREINTRTALPIASSGALEGLKWMGVAALVIVAVIAACTILFFAGWGAWEVGTWLWDLIAVVATATGAWLDGNKFAIGSATGVGAILALALWWAWPKKSDRRNYGSDDMSGWRFFTVGGLIVLIALAAAMWVYTDAHIEANQTDFQTLARAVSEGIYNPKIITP